MRTPITLILTTIIITNSIGQSERVNELTKDSVKTGKWIIYDKDGKISSINFYKAVKGKISHEELFMFNNQIPKDYGHYNKIDSTLHRHVPIGQWTKFWPNGTIMETSYYSDEGLLKMNDQYEYDGSWNLKNIKRWRRNDPKTTFVIGNRDSVELSVVTFREIKQADQFFHLKTHIKNLANKEIRITVLPNDLLKVQSANYLLKEKDSIDMNIKLKISSGQLHETIVLKSNEWTLNLELNAFGYDLSSNYFESGEIKRFRKKFYYYKIGDEYEMEILNTKNRSVPSFIPLSREIVTVELKPGIYELTIVGANRRLTKQIEVE